MAGRSGALALVWSAWGCAAAVEGSAGATVGTRVARWPEDRLPVLVGLVADGGDDAAAWLDDLEDAARAINAAAGRPLLFVLGRWEIADAGLVVPLVLDDPGPRAAGSTELHQRGGFLVAAKMMVRRTLPVTHRPAVLLHELAHALGAQHTGTGALRDRLPPGAIVGLGEEGQAQLRALYPALTSADR